MIEQQNAQNMVHMLHQIRVLSHDHLPLSHSFIPYDILLTILRGVVLDSPPSVKVLFASLKHSESGIRYHFDRLIEMGWIELSTCKKDSRVKICLISKKFQSRVKKYLEEVEGVTRQLIQERVAEENGKIEIKP